MISYSNFSEKPVYQYKLYPFTIIKQQNVGYKNPYLGFIIGDLAINNSFSKLDRDYTQFVSHEYKQIK